MATGQFTRVVEHLRNITIREDGAGLTDGQLLGHFVEFRDNAAVAALVRRHGPMVWGACLRILCNQQDAEDAFQATFLVLMRKAASVVPREMLANWLYGVANRTSLKARSTRAKRHLRERQVTEMPEPALQHAFHDDLQPVLDEELRRLPDFYRSVVVLCDLEGKTRKEAARQLGCPEGTVASRLATARRMLAKRLAQRGLTVSGGALAVALSQNVASAHLPASVASSTIEAARQIAAEQTAATSLVSAKVAALMEGVMKAMMPIKLKTMAMILLALGLVAFSGSMTARHAARAQQDNAAKGIGPASPPTEEPQKPATARTTQPAPKEDTKNNATAKETVLEAWISSVDSLKTGSGKGKYQIYKSTPDGKGRQLIAEYQLRVVFDSPKYKMEFTSKDRDKQIERISELVVIYDGQSIVCKEVSELMSQGEDVKLYPSKDGKPRDAFLFCKFNPVLLQKGVLRLDRFLVNRPETEFQRVDSNLIRGFAAISKPAPISDELVFRAVDRFNLSSHIVKAANGYVQSGSLVWAFDDKTPWVKSIETVLPENRIPITHRLEYATFEPNIKVDPKTFRFSSLGAKDGTRVLDIHTDPNDKSVHRYKNVVDNVAADPNGVEKLIDAVQRLPSMDSPIRP